MHYLPGSHCAAAGKLNSGQRFSIPVKRDIPKPRPAGAGGVRKRNLALAILFLMIFSSGTLSAGNKTLYSIKDGKWTLGSTWSQTGHTGTSCNCIPGNKDVVIIAHDVTFDFHLSIGSNNKPDSLSIKAGGSLKGSGVVNFDIDASGKVYLADTLIARNVNIYNSASFEITSTGYLQVNSNLLNRNLSKQVTVNGYIEVKNDFEASDGSYMTGLGTLHVAGSSSFKGTGVVFGCQWGCCPTYPMNCTFNISALPVSWLGVQVKADGPANKIFWQTASEENNSHFTVERSVNGYFFVPLGTLPGAGTKLTQSNYEFRDAYPPAGKLYYRIKQTDYNGKFDYSPTVSFNGQGLTAQADLQVFPNPMRSGETVICKADWLLPNMEYTAEVTDAQGRRMSDVRCTTIEPGKLTVPSEAVARLGSGLYYIRLTGKESSAASRLVIY